MDKPVEYYLSLPYTRELIPDPLGVWFVRIKELPGCVSQGNTPDEAMHMIEDAMRGWFKVSLEDGDAIPEPRPEEEFSGKFVIRVPKSLHRKLVETAELEEVSLNQYVNATLAEAVGSVAQKAPASEPSLTTWPGLSAGAATALQMAGYVQQAAELDERLFAEWAGQKLHQIALAYRDGFSRELSVEMDELIVILRQNSSRSPALNLFVQTLSFLRRVCDDALKRSGTMPDVQILMQLSQMMSQINRSATQDSSLRIGYSEASAQFETIVENTSQISEPQSHYSTKSEKEW